LAQSDLGEGGEAREWLERDWLDQSLPGPAAPLDPAPARPTGETYPPLPPAARGGMGEGGQALITGPRPEDYAPVDPGFVDTEYAEPPAPAPAPGFEPVDPGFVDTEFGHAPAEAVPEPGPEPGPPAQAGAEPGEPPPGDITGLDADQIVEALRPRDGTEARVGDSYFVWRDNVLYRRLPDGTLEPTGSALGPDSTTQDEEGREWLSEDAEGSVLISVSLRVWATINFAYNSDAIEPDSEGVLEAFSQALRRPALRGKRLLISGHADSTGSEEFNLGLSRRRAASVGNWLVEKGGLGADRLILSGYGASMPVSDNETERGRALNRRVEFILLN
jgi:outer membrane protein OmpA-like peptidoglycan-associated protein